MNKVFINAFLHLVNFNPTLLSLLRFTKYVRIKTLEGDTKIITYKVEMFIGFSTGLHLAALSHWLTQRHLEQYCSLESSSLSRLFKWGRQISLLPFSGRCQRWFGEYYRGNPGRRISPALNGVWASSWVRKRMEMGRHDKKIAKLATAELQTHWQASSPASLLRPLSHPWYSPCNAFAK